MVNQRPDPKTLQRKLLDIRLRYDSHTRDAKQAGKQQRRSRGMAAIRLAELTRWLDDEYGQGVEMPATEHSYGIVRVFAHHLGALRDAPRRITKWADTYAPWIKPRDLERLITETQDCPLKWSADKLAWKLRLTDARRAELKIKTIGAIDCNRDQRKARDRKRRAEREKARRKSKRLAKPVPYI
jgi:hypothetical protein